MQKNTLPADALCESGALCGWSAHGGSHCLTKQLLVMITGKPNHHYTNRKKLLLAMKLTILLLTVAMVNVSASGLSQKVSFKGKNSSLQTVFSAIEKQTGFTVAYNEDLLSKATTVTINVTNLPLTDFLKQVFRNQPLNYSIKNSTIIISGKPATASDPKPNTSVMEDLAPPVPVRIRILDEDGLPLAGASVLVKNTTISGATNIDGILTINVNEGDILIVSYVQHQTKNVKITAAMLSGGTIHTITLSKVSSFMGEVIINKGYYTEKQRLSTANVGRISSQELERQPVTNPLQAMQGRVAGVMITQQNGAPGGPFEVRVRGNNSIASGNNPLYVIDGVPFNSELNGTTTTGGFFIQQPSTLASINPQDIESIEILKDADATSIYGSRGANGVILITTKKARAGKLATSFNISHGFGQLGHYMKLMNKEQYLQYRALAFKTSGTAPTATDVDVNGAWDNNPETNWAKKAIGGKAQYSDVQLSFSGGTGNTSFLLNTAWHKETTVNEIKSPYERRSVHLTVNTSSNDKRLNLQVSGSYASINSNMASSDMMNVATAYPNSPNIYDENGNLNWESDWQNPYSMFEVRNKVNTGALFGSMLINYKLWKNFTAKLTGSYNQYVFNDNQPWKTTYYRPSLNITTGRSYFSYNTTSTWILEPQLNYESKIGNNSFSALAGATLQENRGNHSSMIGTGYIDNNLLGTLAAAAAIDKMSYKKTQYRYRGIYLRLNYNWLDKYIVNATARVDGSSRFAPDSRFRNFGSVAAAWLFSNEDFFKHAASFISFGKLRASYGTMGNDNFADYRYLDLYNYTSFPGSALYQNTQGLYPANLYNPDLVWEENKKLEVALELGMLKDRINVIAVWYRNRSGNQIVDFPIAGTTGFSTIYMNLPAIVQNAGWELTINSTNINTGGFRWRSTLNLTDYTNKLVSFPGLEKSATYSSRLVVGEPLTNNKRFKYAGVDPLTGLYTFRTASGAITFAPQSATDRIVNTNDDPQLFGGFGNTFTYKGFELDVFFQFCKKIGNNPLFFHNSPHGYFRRIDWLNTSPEVLNAWQKPGDITNIQRLSPLLGAENGTYTSVKGSDYNWVDASYAKLKNLMFSWQLTRQMREKLKLQNGRIYIQCQNLFTITGYKGWDPEPNQDQLTLPPLRIVTAGIQLTF